MLYRKPDKLPERPGVTHRFTVSFPVDVQGGPGSTGGDAAQRGDDWVRDTLKPALEKLSGGPVTIYTDKISK